MEIMECWKIQFEIKKLDALIDIFSWMIYRALRRIREWCIEMEKNLPEKKTALPVTPFNIREVFLETWRYRGETSKNSTKAKPKIDGDR